MYPLKRLGGLVLDWRAGSQQKDHTASHSPHHLCCSSLLPNTQLATLSEDRRHLIILRWLSNIVESATHSEVNQTEAIPRFLSHTDSPAVFSKQFVPVKIVFNVIPMQEVRPPRHVALPREGVCGSVRRVCCEECGV